MRLWAAIDAAVTCFRSSVPLCASSARPIAAVPCGPGRWRPNSSVSSTEAGTAAQSTVMSGRSERRLRAWMAWATSSLPTPRSPSMTVAASLGATASIRS